MDERREDEGREDEEEDDDEDEEGEGESRRRVGVMGVVVGGSFKRYQSRGKARDQTLSATKDD